MSKENKDSSPSKNEQQPVAGAAAVTASDTKADESNQAAVEVNGQTTEWMILPRSIERHLRWKRRLQSGVPIVTVTVSLVALLVIIAQAIIYNEQRQIMHRQVQISEDSLHVSERAYVGVASITANLAQGEIVILLENTGKIPAKNITVEAKEYRVTANIVGSTTKFNAGSVSLFPGSYKMRVVVAMNKFKPEEIDAIQARTESLVIAGKVQYDDGFGVSVSTDFAFEYSPPRNEDWTAMSTWPAEIEPVLELRAYSLSQNHGVTIVSAQPDVLRPSLGKTYARTPNQSWTPLSTPVVAMRPTIESRKNSPTPSQSSTPLITQNASTPLRTPNARSSKPQEEGQCGCFCTWVCDNRCEFYCTGCSLSEQIKTSDSCCAEAHKATGDIGPCPK